MSEQEHKPIVIREQGSFLVGGSVARDTGTFDRYNPPDPYTQPKDPKDVKHVGQSSYGDHAYVFYQIPENPRRLPLLLLHGGLQSAKTWETTPDGREGFQNIFLRRNFSVYLPDQPRRGKAGRATIPGVNPVTCDAETQFNIFRLGLWPDFFEGVQFSRDPEALNQFFRMGTPNTAECDAEVVSDAISAAFDKIGEAILVTHSQGGGFGWRIACKNPNVRAIIAFEPGSGFVFPENEVPETMRTCFEWSFLPAAAVSRETFMRLTKIPIIIYYGDNIADEPDPQNLGRDHWRVRVAMAKLWVDKINAYGGSAELVRLPDIGIHGNTHCIMSDLNNLEIADLISNWLHAHGLD
jgi:pimeloyl-ACP methyl ester carboxylesterase